MEGDRGQSSAAAVGDKKQGAPLLQLVEVNGSPCLKLTEDEEKMTVPGTKTIYRLFDAAGELGHLCLSAVLLTCSITLSLVMSLIPAVP